MSDERLVCAMCGRADDHVARYSPDMDITPVPLCRICVIEMIAGPIDPGATSRDAEGRTDE